MTQKAINYAEVLCELNIDAAELSEIGRASCRERV